MLLKQVLGKKRTDFCIRLENQKNLDILILKLLTKV